MSENNNKKPEEGTEKKPAAKKNAGKKPETTEKEGIWKRFVGFCKRNWKYAAAGVGGAALGAGATYGAGKLGERKSRRQSETYQEDYSPIDPNL